MSLHPSDGLRVLLELVEGSAEGARYRGSVFTPDERANFEVELGRPAETSALTVTLVAEAPDAAIRVGERGPELLAAIARTMGKHALEEAPPRWPRRVLRWRKA